MTDVTTRPAKLDIPSPRLEPIPTTATAADMRTARRIARAEQARISADAEVERRARAAQLDLELREQRRAVARRERQAAEQDKQARVRQRRERGAARRAVLRVAVARSADRAVFILPILFPMAVAWVGQIRFAMTVMHWALPAAVVFAAGFELSTAYVARLDWLSRAKGDAALLFRAATWGFAAGAALMNYWHAAGPNFAPNGEAVSYGLMSLTGVVLWELLSTYRHRASLRAEGKLPAARPRYGLARWVWFRPLTRLAWLLALRDGYPTTDLAWRAAINAVEFYGSPRTARKAIRAGRPVPGPVVVEDKEDRNEAGAGERDGRDKEPVPALPPATLRDNPNGDLVKNDHSGLNANFARDTAENLQAAGKGAAGSRSRAGHAEDGADRRPKSRHATHAVIAKMKLYAQQRAAEGTPVTGAELDREFGTRDYGRRVLRQFAAVPKGNGVRQP